MVEGNRKHGLIISFFSSAKIMQELELFYENHFYLLHTIQRETHSIYCIFTFLKIVFKSCLDHCPYCAGITAVIPSSPIIQACWFLLKYSNSPDILSYSTQDFPTLICQKRKVWTWGLVFCFDFSLGFFFYLQNLKESIPVLSRLKEYTSSSAQRVQNNLKHDRWAPFMRLSVFVLYSPTFSLFNYL